MEKSKVVTLFNITLVNEEYDKRSGETLLKFLDI
jgi:hypothetical protein